MMSPHEIDKKLDIVARKYAGFDHIHLSLEDRRRIVYDQLKRGQLTLEEIDSIIFKLEQGNIESYIRIQGRAPMEQ